MNRIQSAKLYAAGSILLPAAVVIIRPSLLWANLLFLVWTAAAAVLWVHADRRQHRQQLKRSLATIQQASIQTLNHHRHDWMNDLQVLYGYIRMNKPDRALASVERIRDKMLMESKISKLGSPALTAYLQSFRTFSPSIVLDVEIEDNVSMEELDGDRDGAAEALIEVINAYRFSTKPGVGDPALLKLRLYRGSGALMVELEFDGELTDEAELIDKLEQRLHGTPLQADSLQQHRHVLLKAPLCA
ncbi:Spo0B domain-containing protein [Paenibacillus pasadenensis]|uniref:Spo0B domain-containing protein n=1 Tax=Paenibacillus pasadenensis TaxID=217090 RepID=UPI00203BFD58|nr:Spo0B domain-containing protein [Paenibacillus pasadenensis]MCM3746703.1 Spo0B domain-containing protein [Paenibacillus pasadenensis]